MRYDRVVPEPKRLLLKRSSAEGFHAVAKRMKASKALTVKLRRICNTVARRPSGTTSLSKALRRFRVFPALSNT